MLTGMFLVSLVNTYSKREKGEEDRYTRQHEQEQLLKIKQEVTTLDVRQPHVLTVHLD